MKRFTLAALLALTCSAAHAQSSPGLFTGQVPSATQWNSYFAGKQDTLGYTPLNPSVVVPALTSTGALLLPSGTTAQQPDTGNAGEVRYNSATGRYEFGVGGSWLNHVRLSGDTMTGALTLSAAGTALLVTNNATVGGTLGVTGALTGGGTINVGTGTGNVNLFQGSTGAVFQFRLGGSSSELRFQDSSANSLFTINGTNLSIQRQFVIGPGVWSTSGPYFNNGAPIFQNNTISGSTSSATASQAMFLQQTDSSATTNANTPSAVFEHLIVAAGATGAKSAGQFTLDINTTANTTTGFEYTALLTKCNLGASDGVSPGSASCFGFNPVAHIATGVTASQVVGTEIDTWVQSGAVVTDRIGLQVVDIHSTVGDGVQASRDDVALSMNNQYGPSSSLGFKVGLEFGRAGGFFPVVTTGTLISAQGNGGASWTVSNGIDWHLGTATGKWVQYGSAFFVDGAGRWDSAKVTASGAAPGAGQMRFEVVTGTNAGSCKLIAYAGTSTTPVTVVDNVGSSC